jgi:hypothetical protein
MMRCKHCGQIVKYERDYLVPDEAFNARLTIKEWVGTLSWRICSERGGEDGVHELLTETEEVEQMLKEYDQ